MDLNGEFNTIFIIVIVLGAVAMLLLALGYYFLFVMQRKPAAWKLELAKRYRKLTALDLDKRMLLLELDKLTEYALKQRFNAKDKSFGAILKQQHKKFGRQDLDAIWAAHKLRNKLVHDIDFNPRPSELNHAIILYKKVIANFINN